MKKSNWLAVAGALSMALLAGCNKGGAGAAGEAKGGAAAGPGAQVAAANPATPVNIGQAVEKTVTRATQVTGSIGALQTVDLTPKVAANVVTVAGREGDPVRRGQVVVLQDPRDFESQVRQNEANVQSAQVKLQQATTQANVQITASSAGVQDAQQALKSAQEQLALARNPQRTEEVQVAQNNVAQAQANYDRAVSDRKRYDDLVREGAAAQITLDQYLTQEKVQKAALNSARELLQVAQTGGRAETIRTAQTAVARAQTQLRLARANTQQTQIRRDDIAAARSAIAQAQAALSLSRQQLASTRIVSPIDGIIATRSTEPGSLAAPGQPVVRLVGLDTVYFEAQVPETDISSVARGRSVTVSVDALPGRTFTGKVAEVYPTASTTSRNFKVRITIPNGGKILRPGMYARGQVIVEQHRGVVVPKDALVADGDNFAVFVVDGNKATRRPVKVGIQTTETSEILSGVRAGETIIVNGQNGLKDGSPVQIEKTPASGAATASAGGAAG